VTEKAENMPLKLLLTGSKSRSNTVFRQIYFLLSMFTVEALEKTFLKK